MTNEPHARSAPMANGRFAAEFKPSWKTSYQQVKGEIKGKYGVLTWKNEKDAEIAAWKALNDFENSIRSERGLTVMERAEQEFQRIFGGVA